MSVLKNIGKKIGLDKSIAYSSGARVIQGVAGVGSMFFISAFLTGVEQGFYFTFGSILALQVFFELGLTGIMTQYVAHEASHLQIDENAVFHGEEKYRSRLSSLLHFCVKWYSVLAILVLVTLSTIGFIYFKKYGETQSADVAWRTPWVLICMAASCELFIAPLTSICTGLGYVKQTSKISFFRQLIVPLVTWMGLAFNFKLYVLGMGHIMTILIWLFFTYKQGLLRILRNIWKIKVTERVSYMKEIFPYQWRIALSWVSGYFIFQLFNPVLFATEGAEVAGQMGMTLQALNAITAFSMSWLNTKVPLYSKLIALKDYVQLDSIFYKTLKQMASVCGSLLVCFYLFIWVLRLTQLQMGSTVFADRFLGYLPMLLMMIPVFQNMFVNSWATYLRCHKKEPWLWNSVCCGVLCMLSTLTMGKYFGLYGVTGGYCLIQLLFLPWGIWIFRTKKKEWHSS